MLLKSWEGLSLRLALSPFLPSLLLACSPAGPVVVIEPPEGEPGLTLTCTGTDGTPEMCEEWYKEYNP